MFRKTRSLGFSRISACTPTSAVKNGWLVLLFPFGFNSNFFSKFYLSFACWICTRDFWAALPPLILQHLFGVKEPDTETKAALVAEICSSSSDSTFPNSCSFVGKRSLLSLEEKPLSKYSSPELLYLLKLQLNNIICWGCFLSTCVWTGSHFLKKTYKVRKNWKSYWKCYLLIWGIKNITLTALKLSTKKPLVFIKQLWKDIYIHPHLLR